MKSRPSTAAMLVAMAMASDSFAQASTTSVDYADSRLAEAEDDERPWRRRPSSNPGRSERETPARVIDGRNDLQILRHRLTLSGSIVRLLSPIGEGMLELRVAGRKPSLSLSLIGGYGTTSREVVRANQPTTEVKATVYEIGGQLSLYPLACIESFHLGFEALYIAAALDSATPSTALVGAEGLGVGPFAGYKLVTKSGFTVLGQLGLAYVAKKARYANTAVEQPSGSTSSYYPFLNLNVGWTW